MMPMRRDGAMGISERKWKKSGSEGATTLGPRLREDDKPLSVRRSSRWSRSYDAGCLLPNHPPGIPRTREMRNSAIDRLTAFHAMPLTNAASYDPVRSKILPDIQP